MEVQMSTRLCQSRHVCRLGILALAILAGYAAQPLSERMMISQVHAAAATLPCVI
jgi:hypothetical protein